MNLRLSRYKFNAKIISDDPKLNVPHTHPLYTFSIHVCVSASFLLVFPIFSYSLRKSQPNMTVVIRVSREARRVAEGRRSSLACTDECRLDREIQREKVELGCVLERESRTLCQKEQGMMSEEEGGRKREEHGRANAVRSIGTPASSGGFPVYRRVLLLPAPPHPRFLPSFILRIALSLSISNTRSASFTVARFLLFVALRSYYFFPYDDSFVPSSSHSLNSSKSREFCDERRT